MNQGPITIGNSDSRNMPHKRYRGSRQTFYVTQYPEGDYSIHGTAGGGDGYGGYKVEFLMEDGTVEVVKGPFNLAELLYGVDKTELAQLMGVAESDLESATRLTFGQNLWTYGGKPKQVVHEETGFTVGEWRDRVCEKFAGLEVKVTRRHASSYRNVDQILKEKAST